MDAQLRQRLIGAFVLIALAVIFLPMLLNGPRPVSNEEISLVLPPPGAAPANPSERTVTLPADRLTTQPEPDSEAVALVDTATAPPPEELAVDPAPVRAPAQVETAPATPAPVPAAPVPTAAATPPPAPHFDAASTVHGPYFLQLGSYSQPERAQALVDQLQKLGIPARYDPFQSQGRTLQKVRSGGYPSRTAAEAARLKAVGAISGLSASVAEAALPGATAPARVPAGAKPGFAVQLGVFGDGAKANELMDKAKKAGMAAYVERITAANGPAHRVRVGPVVNKADAEALREQARTRLGVTGMVVTYP